jgi:SH3 domain protein
MKAKAVLLTMFLLLVISAPGFSKTSYVRGTMTVPARMGPSDEYKIVGTARTGDVVEVTEESGDWSFVRLGEGREGWVLSRYLTDRLPDPELVQQLQTQQQADKQRIAQLEEENLRLKGDQKGGSEQLAELQRRYEELRLGSQDYLRLKEEHEQALRQVQESRIALEQREHENKDLVDAKNVQWFLAGAGVFFVSWIIGFALGRSRRRKKSDLTFSLK